MGLGLGANIVLLAFLLTRSQPEPHSATAAPLAPVAHAAREPIAPAPAPTPATVSPAARPSPSPPPATARKDSPSKPAPPEPSRRPARPAEHRRSRCPPVSVSSGPEPAPLLDTLPAGARRGLPALSLDLHAYSPDADKRFIVVNGRRYREGEQLGEGPVLETVTATGAILRQGGQRFRLPVRR
ncbi:MAG: general secretion pathway protein GspB [Chromatiales bacterium]|nr:general secretion pathway protein GspB [Chromatiales bacterium]